MAQRVLNRPLRDLGRAGIEFRFGLNAVGDETRDILSSAMQTDFVNAFVIDCPENISKYPMMRRLFYDKPLLASLVMWFDDDSCVIPTTEVEPWLDRIQQQMTAYTMLGSVHRERFVGNQIDWIKVQPWYNGKEPGAYTQFAAGGWWTMRTEPLLRFNWPPRAFLHRGGDVMTGELLRQHDMRLGHFRDNLWINANEYGVESQSIRRGKAGAPIGYDYPVPV
jgi:hypothetical protein